MNVKPMLVLGVETSCDDTAAAVLVDGRRVAANVVSSQDEIHSPYGGVVPELASRQHVRHILPIIDGALGQAGVALNDLDGIAVTRGPGLVGSLLVGLSVVKGISYRWRIPYVGVNHLEAHLLAIFLDREIPFPYLSLLASGGHTLLYLVRDFGDYRFLGGTRDDAAGEAYDKVAKMMGLGYPGGRVIDQLAKSGDPRAIAFPRARMKKNSYEFSFSGLKTAVWHYLKDRDRGEWEARKADVAASFQEAVVDMLVAPTLRAATDLDVKRIVLAGGVAANSRLREKMAEAARAEGVEVHFPPPSLCTDNGAMIALAGYHSLKRGKRDDFSLNADADLTL
jgi:N6-L-threonylcarbamoyladenine synthase